MFVSSSGDSLPAPIWMGPGDGREEYLLFSVYGLGNWDQRQAVWIAQHFWFKIWE